MDFARKQLEKYGWKDGEGLGAKKMGIAKPIKARLKFDNSGLGHSISNELINPWWQRVYDNAANNVKVKKKKDGVKVKRLGESVEITTKRKKSKTGNVDNGGYSNFVKRGSLNWDGEKHIGEQSDEDSEEPNFKKKTSGICDLTDDELFKVCGGRTAHKGARHGLSMSAKLARLEEQEEKIVEVPGKKKKKKKKNI